jgi:iron complex outermembrane recepter protein
MFKGILIAIAATGVLGQLVPERVSAEEAASPQPEESSAEGGLAEITVTAQKISQDLQKVPLSVTALSADALDKLGITNIADLAKGTSVPGLSLMPFSAHPDLFFITLRGLQNPDPAQGTIDSPTPILVDDVYDARGFTAATGVAEIERVEVLRGPQGTLFGRNAEGGAIRFVTKEPTGEFGGKVEVGGGNYGEHIEAAHLNLPEIAGFALKLDAKQDKNSGYVTNIASSSALAAHSNFGIHDAEGARITALFKGIDTFKAKYFFEFDESRGTAATMQHTPAPSGPCAGGIACAGNTVFFAQPPSNVGTFQDRTWIGLYNGPQVTTNAIHALNLEWDFAENMALKSITTYAKQHQNYSEWNDDGTYAFVSLGPTGLPGAFFIPYNGNGIAAGGLNAASTIYGLTALIPVSYVGTTSESEEIQFTGNTPQFNWVSGLYYYTDSTSDSRLNAFTVAYTGFANGVPTNPVATNPFTIGPAGETDSYDHVHSYSAFGQGTWTPAWNDKVHVTGGLRYSHEYRTFFRTYDSGVLVDVSEPTFRLSRVDPAFNLAFDLTDSTNIYARYGSAYRAGGADVRAPWVGPLSQFSVFKAETTKSIEEGIKTEILDHRLRINTATYYSWVNGMLLNVLLNPIYPNIDGKINLPGSQRIQGIETEAVYAVTPQLVLTANATLQSFTFSPEVVRYNQTVDPGAEYGPQLFPATSFLLGGDYTVPMAIGNIGLHIDWNRTGSFRGQQRTSPGLIQTHGSINVANANVSWQAIKAGPTTLTLKGYVTNLGNTVTNTYPGPAGEWTPSIPRMYGIDLTAAF